TMLLVSLPFIYIGVVLTLHRLRAAGAPLSLVLFFFVPLVNLLLFLVLILLPTRETIIVDYVDERTARRLWKLRQAHLRWAGAGYWRSGAVALAITVPLAVVGVVLGAIVLESYGFRFFVGAPFALGMISVLLFGFSRPQPFGACIGVAMISALLAGLAIV